jgi:predicted DNA-binding transcriptional regulator AlpA
MKAEGETMQEPGAPRPKPAKQSVHWVTLDDVLARYGISRATLDRKIALEEFPDPVKLGGLRRWDMRELEEFEARSRAARDSMREVRRAKRREREG